MQDIISENKKDQKEFPEIKEQLDKDLTGLKRYENQLLNELNQCNYQNKLHCYD